VSTSKVLLGGAWAVVLGGCALGYGVGHTTAKGSATSNPRSGIVEDEAHSFGTFYQELRVIDSTGLVLAALVNAGRQHNARAEAIERAQYQRPNAEGKIKVEYSWEPMPILSGLLTDLRIRLPLGTPSLDGMETEQVSYWGFDVRPEFITFRPIDRLPLVSSLFMSVELEEWKRPAPSGVDLKFTEFDMTFGSATSYVIRDDVTATGRVAVGMLSPIFGLLSGGPLFNPSVEVEVGWRPFRTDHVGVMVSGVGYFGREFAVDRSVWEPRVGVNVAFTFGKQVPRKRAEPAAPPPGDAPVSGVICVGAAPSPGCARIMKETPPGVQLLFATCAQATIEAVESKRFDTQPGVCRSAGKGIATFLAEHGATLDPEIRRLTYVAAAATYDFAAAGYEAGRARHGNDHCAMIEATFDAVIGPTPDQPMLPDKIAVIDAEVTTCRATHTCRRTDDRDVVCEDR
jgi:hypothetical protein